MTKDEALHLAEMLTAYADGKMVQYRFAGAWCRWDEEAPVRFLVQYPSRIKPKSRVFWANLIIDEETAVCGRGWVYDTKKDAELYAGKGEEMVRVKVLDDE